MDRSVTRVRTTAAYSALVLGIAGLSACSGDAEDAGSDPGDVAGSLASALSDGDVSRIGFDGISGDEAQRDLDRTLSGMGDERPTVAVGDVTEDGRTATATLNVSWSLGDEGDAEWSYETEATLHESGDTWRPEWSHALLAEGLRDGERLSLVRTTGDRGDILGAGGKRIVEERPVVRFGIDKAHTKPAHLESSARALAELVDVDAADFVERVKAYGPDAFVEAIVLRKEDAADVDADAYRRIDGALQIADTLPLAPTSEFAAPILGSVGEATAELIKESGGELAAGDETGLSGLQLRYDDQLRGEPGVTVEAVTKSDERELFSSEPEDGEPLRTTLDLEAQTAAEDALSSVDSPSALVAILPARRSRSSPALPCCAMATRPTTRWTANPP